eukprot:scaffold73017_cov61-Attheya_sp.AAC.1
MYAWQAASGMKGSEHAWAAWHVMDRLGLARHGIGTGWRYGLARRSIAWWGRLSAIKQLVCTAHGQQRHVASLHMVERHMWRGRSEARVEMQDYSCVGQFDLGIGYGRARQMATLEERICGLKDRVGVMQRLILGMAQ